MEEEDKDVGEKKDEERRGKGREKKCARFEERKELGSREKEREEKRREEKTRDKKRREKKRSTGLASDVTGSPSTKISIVSRSRKGRGEGKEKNNEKGRW